MMRRPFPLPLAIGIGVTLAAVMAFSMAAPAVDAQTSTPRPDQNFVIDWNNSRTCTTTTSGHNVTTTCEVEWVNANYSYTNTRLLGFYAVADETNYIENYRAGLTAFLPGPPYWANGATYLERERVTSSNNPHNDIWTRWGNNPNDYPGTLTCASFLSWFPGQTCEAVHASNKPYDASLNIWPSIKIQFYNKTWTSGMSGNEGPPRGTATFTVYPVVALMNGSTLATATPTTTSTPTPAGTPVYATQLPFPTAFCITATTTSAQATPTPFYSGSPTPTRTGTPPTATPVITATQAMTTDTFISEIAEFPVSLSPWTKVSVFQYPAPVEAAWSAEAGPDGISGTARLTYNALTTMPFTSTNAPVGGIVWTRGSTIPSPLYLKVSMKSDGIRTGTYNFLALWVKDARGTWMIADVEEVGTGWREVTFYTADFPPYSAVGLAGYSCDTRTWQSCVPKSYSDGFTAGVLVDDVQVVAGSYLGQISPIPVCTVGTDSNGRTYRACHVPVQTVDAYSACIAPVSFLDLGAWFPWLGCKIFVYFAWNGTNSTQYGNIGNFLDSHEPIGSLNDLGVLAEEIRTIAEDIREDQPNEFVVTDFSQIFSTSGLGPIDLHVPGEGNMDVVLIDCQISNENVSEGFRKGVCWSIWMLRSMPATALFLQMLQFLLDASAAFFMVRSLNKMYQTLSK